MTFPFDSFPYFPEFDRALHTRAFPLDVTRKGDTYTVTADLPGVSPEDVDVNVDGTQLTITAERSVPVVDDEQALSRERVSGKASRQLTLSSAIATDKITAEMDQGVLTLTLPLAESAKPHKIAVTAPAAVSA